MTARDSDILWSLVPRLDALNERYHSTGSKSLSNLRLLMRTLKADGYAGPTFNFSPAHRVMIMSSADNHRYVLEPLLSGQEVEIVDPPTRRNREFPMGRGIPLQVPSALRLPLNRLYFRMVGLYEDLQITLHQVRPRIICLASTQTPEARLTMRVARRHGIPTYWIPHAPIARTRDYRDLPVDGVGLATHLDLSWYREHDVKSKRLAACGSPHLHQRKKSKFALPGGAIIVAPSPWGHDLVRGWLKDIARLNLPEVFVGLHPRLRSTGMYRLVRRLSFEVLPHRTADYLGPGIRLVQHNSGVAYEGLFYGAQVLDFNPNGEEPLYVFQDSSAVRSANDVPELSSLLRGHFDSADQGADVRKQPVGTHARNLHLKHMSFVCERGPSVILDQWTTDLPFGLKQEEICFGPS